MILVFYISLLLLYTYCMINNKYKFMFYIIPANFALDMLVVFFETGGITAQLRGFIFGFYLVTLIITSNNLIAKFPLQKKRYMGIVSIIAIILIYWLFLVLFSSNIINSLREFTRITIILLAFPAGFIIGSLPIGSYDFFRRLNNASVLVLFIASINILISNIFKINQTAYSTHISFYSGGLYLSLWYVLPLAIMYVLGYRILLLKSGLLLKEKILIFLSFLWILLSWRRTAFVVLVLGVLFLVYYSRKYTKFFANLVIVVFAAFLMVGSTFLDLYEARKKTIDKGIEEEGRFLETEWVFTEIFSFNNLSTSLFGTEIFNTAGNYLNGAFEDRPLHVDINIILWGSGLLGLFLYLFLHYKIYRVYKFLRLRLQIQSNTKQFASFIFLFFFSTTVIVSFSGGLQAITYRSYLYLIMGATLGHVSILSMKK